jgi:hypothetical protein
MKMAVQTLIAFFGMIVAVMRFFLGMTRAFKTNGYFASSGCRTKTTKLSIARKFQRNRNQILTYHCHENDNRYKQWGEQESPELHIQFH